MKSENPGLHTAATIFVKFASQMGIIVSEALLREHFSVYGEILDITIRTITVYEVLALYYLFAEIISLIWLFILNFR